MAMTDAERLRLLVGERIPEGMADSDTFFTDARITDLLTLAGDDLAAAAAEGWRMKAAHYANLVNVTEAGASRQMSDLHKHALEMEKLYRSQVLGVTPETGRTRIGDITRS